MKLSKNPLMVFLLLFLFRPFLYPLSDVKIYDRTEHFRHFETVLNPTGTLKEFHQDRIVTDDYPAKVIENDFIRLTVVPDYGGRILSMIYKPTGKELLYQNPMGTVFGWNNGSFYYNYLMVWGGIFPVFPEPDHGKTWNQPWTYRISVHTPEQVSIEMRFIDNIEPQLNTPYQFRHGKTWITCVVTISVRKNSSAVEWNVQLQNNKSEDIAYEYWTCMTVAPGSYPGSSALTGNTAIIIPTWLVKLQTDSWNWMIEKNQGYQIYDNVVTYNRLSTFSNWQDKGMLYAYPYLTNKWFGVLNRNDTSGFFHASQRTNELPGLKVWTWGYEQSVHYDWTNALDQKRPYIELWSGNSPEFYVPAHLLPNQKKKWSEFFMPTFGLTNVNFVNENAAVFLYSTRNRSENRAEFHAEVFTQYPGSEISAEMRLVRGKWSRTVLQTNFISDPGECAYLETGMNSGSIEPGHYLILLILKNSKGNEIASTSLHYRN